MNLSERVRSLIRDVPDFPKKGILFRDITTLLADPKICGEIVDFFCEDARAKNVSAIAGIESRGFIFGPMVAFKLGVPFVMIRKKGKLPYHRVTYKYELEYGSAEIEMHTDAVKAGQSILVHDDVLATGGTALAACKLLESQGAVIGGLSFLIELTSLGGVSFLEERSKNIRTLVSY